MTSETLSFVVLADTHFVPRGGSLYGLDPRARLEAAVAMINREHADAAFVLIAGDLAHWGEAGAYESFAEAIAPLGPPVVLMLGNHDRRAAFRAVFAEADDDGAGFVQGVRGFAAATLITLDTLDEAGRTHAGLLCAARLEFLERALAEAPADRPIILAQHHPAREVGIPSMDKIRLLNAGDLWAVFERTGRRPDLMLHGHVHRPIFGTWRGIPIHIQRALNHQVGYDRAGERIPGTHEAPDLSVVTVDGEGIVIHQRSFLYDGPAFFLDDPDAAAGRIAGV